MKVCEKVRKKGTTSYNEVADELVAEFTNSAMGNSLAEQVCNVIVIYSINTVVVQFSFPLIERHAITIY